MRGPGLILLTLAALASQACVARAVGKAVMLPVRAVEAGVDATTTTQSEADEDRGREIRKREERLGKLQREYDKQLARCQDGDERACTEAQGIKSEMEVLLPGIPAEPQRD